MTILKIVLMKQPVYKTVNVQMDTMYRNRCIENEEVNIETVSGKQKINIETKYKRKK